MISVLAEPALLAGLAAVAKSVGDSSLAGITGGTAPGEWVAAAPVVVLVAAALFAVLLAETARIPVDDPNTHLELTMVHEVMVLDHSGPDLAFIMYTSALKLWLIGAVVMGVLIPAGDLSPWASVALTTGGMVVMALMIGVIESVMARFRMSRLPVFLAAALTLSVVALLLAFR
jgi:formate hydrogenlyase subunit 4